jgi:hypothetical protein
LLTDWVRRSTPTQPTHVSQRISIWRRRVFRAALPVEKVAGVSITYNVAGVRFLDLKRVSTRVRASRRSVKCCMGPATVQVFAASKAWI